MTKLATCMIAVILASAVLATAGETLKINIPSVTSGKCSMTLLDKDGIRPLAGAKLSLLTVKDGSEATSVVTDQAGKCIVKLEEGRYILNVNDKNITLVDASEKGQMAWCRIVVSDKPMLVGGQTEGEVVAVSGGLFGAGTTGSIAIIGGVTCVVVGGVAYAIDEYNDDDDDDDELAEVTVTDTTPVKKSSPSPSSP